MTNRSKYVQEFKKENYKSVTVYFPGKKEKEIVKAYAMDYKHKTLRQYILEMLMNENEIEELAPIHRKIRYSGSSDLSPYILLIPKENYGKIIELTGNMRISSYIVSRIEGEMNRNGYSMFSYENAERYMIFYAENGCEKVHCVSTLAQAEMSIKELCNAETIKDILLIDTVLRERTYY